MIYISFSFFIIVDLFAAKIAGCTLMWTTYDTETSTYLLAVNARILHKNRVAHRSIQLKILQLSGKHTTMSFISFSFFIIVDLLAAKIAGYTFMWTTYETETSTYL